ncbi:asparagine synthase-related protein [Asticcacaulis sp.]|uniref:asparagine synthase-related protein n=1 Tax=Asticcacaulis sp. TaxID=1872648 RepID=UPI003F7B8ACE
MAQRFLIQISKATGAKLPAPALPRDFACLDNSDEVKVYSNDVTLSVGMPGADGIIIGHLFSQGGKFPRVHSLTEAQAQSIVASSGQSLVNDFWGGYVAVWHGRGDKGVSVLRDPSGTLPCYYIDGPEDLVLASDVELLLEAGTFTPAVDWDFLTDHLLFYELRSERTALKGIAELLPSVRLDTSVGGLSKTALWFPWTHTSPRGLTPSDLRTVIALAIQSWGNCFDQIALGVSGGLDSSIVAASLAGKGNGLTCYTFATDDPEGDERIYARCLTDALNVELVEKFYDQSDVDIHRSTAKHLARPLLFAFGQSVQKMRRDLTRDRGIDAFFTGIGGDNILCSLYSPSPLIDRLYTEGLSKGLWETLLDISEISEATVWQVVAGASRLAFKSAPPAWKMETKLLGPAVTRRGRLDLTHPWHDQPKNALPGKTIHVGMFQRIQGTIDGLDRTSLGPQINALLSQPIVEACLSVPSWQWCSNGENRSMARAAFAGKLPERILRRRSKGGPGSFAHRVVEANRGKIRDLLLGGQLVQQGLIDADQVRVALSDQRPLDAVTYWRLLELSEAEVWSRYWLDRSEKNPVNRSVGVA